MPTRLILYPYRLGSRSCRAIQDNTRQHRPLRVRPDGRYRPYRNHLIVNWGNGRVPNWWNELALGRTLNHPLYVRTAGNKLDALNRMYHQDVRVPEYTTDRGTAQDWLDDGELIVARQLLRAHSGRGILIPEPGETVPPAPLYTKYSKGRAEYRIHVFGNRAIHVSQKRMMRRERRPEGFQARVRNHANGWVFCHEVESVPTDVLVQSIRAVQALELDFGAVDVKWNAHYEQATVLEVNTAPGLEGITLSKYVHAINEELNQ